MRGDERLVGGKNDNMMINSTNVDQDEIRKFEAFARKWWDRNGDFKSLHDINPLRVDYIRGRTGLKDRAVLDVGCGAGLLSESLAALGARVTGIDMGEAPLAVARLHQKKNGYQIDYRQVTVEAYAEARAGQYDAVICMELLEHVPRPASVVSACARLVRPGGDLFFATLNRNLKSFVMAIVGAEYILRLLPVGTHRWSRFIRPDELKGWGKRAGLDCVDLSGLHYNPFTRHYWVGGNTHVNYLMHFQRGG